MRLLSGVVVAPVLSVRLGGGFNRAGIEGGIRFDDAWEGGRRPSRGEVREGTLWWAGILWMGVLRAAVGVMVEVVAVVVVDVAEPAVCVCVEGLMPIFEDSTGTRARSDGVVWMCACACACAVG